MKISLVMCPGWSVSAPPYSLALLKGALKAGGIASRCHDFNLDFYSHVHDAASRRSWDWSQMPRDWGGNEEFISRIMTSHGAFIQEYVAQLLCEEPDVIGFSVNLMNRRFTQEIIRLVRQTAGDKVYIVIGGPECRHPDRAADDLRASLGADAVCTGDGEWTFPAFLARLGRGDDSDYGNIITSKPGTGANAHPGPTTLEGQPYADYSDFDFSRYSEGRLTVQFSRGCVNNCVFCDEESTSGLYRRRPPSEVVSEIEQQLALNPRAKGIAFSDVIINADIRALGQLADLIVEKGLRFGWHGQAAIRQEMSPAVLLKLKNAGCAALGYGVESGSDKIIKSMRKRFDAELAKEVIRRTHDAGIDVYYNLIVGFPGEEPSDFEKTLGFVEETAPFVKAIHAAPLYISPRMQEDLAAWGIDPRHPDALRWRSLDAANTHEERTRRLETLRTLIERKGIMFLTYDA